MIDALEAVEHDVKDRESSTSTATIIKRMTSMAGKGVMNKEASKIHAESAATTTSGDTAPTTQLTKSDGNRNDEQGNDQGAGGRRDADPANKQFCNGGILARTKNRRGGGKHKCNQSAR
mmetsp:Transcript_30857/g.61093  ORF Transcript_30857/g.61093 Transcript_30857/m.61093 type:complete len:119 (+) Transcript_30857:1619-1975(+)